MDLMQQMAADVKAVPKDEALGRIAALASQQLELTAEIENVAASLAELSNRLKRVQEEELPSAMLEIGIQEFKLATGGKITIKKFYSGSINDENREACFKWLAEHNHDDIIKNDYAIAFGKGDDDQAQEFERRLTELGYQYKHKKHVHPQTLNAFIKEQIETGAEFPLDTFKVYSGSKAIIK